jgi:hypothetical protein
MSIQRWNPSHADEEVLEQLSVMDRMLSPNGPNFGLQNIQLHETACPRAAKPTIADIPQNGIG